VTRSEFLKLLMAASLTWCAPALADEGGGGGNSGPGGGGDGGGDNSGHGGGDDDDGDGDDHDKARQDSEKGKAAKLKAILKTVRRRYPGDVVSVKYMGGSKAYRIKVLNGAGKLITISVDAASAAILNVTGQ
jgi:hypothetical protein